MNIRKIKLPEDFDVLSEMMLNTFQYPENPDWSIQEDEKEEFTRMIKSFKKTWPLINLLGLFSKGIKNLIVGSIAEENGIPMGVIIYQQKGTTNNWYISTVGVLPEYRRRGIARKLVETGIEHMRELGAKIISLDVISGNLPAYSLYKDVGFSHFSGLVEMHLNPDFINHVNELPKEVEMIDLALFDWQPRYDLFDLITPDEVKKYEPIEVGRFKQPAVMRIILPIILFAQGINKIYQLVQVNGEIVGRLSIDIKKKPGGKHNISLYLDEDHADLGVKLIEYGLEKINETGIEKKVSTGVSQWQPHVIETFKRTGFEIKVEGHRLGLLVKNEEK